MSGATPIKPAEVLTLHSGSRAAQAGPACATWDAELPGDPPALGNSSIAPAAVTEPVHSFTAAAAQQAMPDTEKPAKLLADPPTTSDKNAAARCALTNIAESDVVLSQAACSSYIRPPTR